MAKPKWVAVFDFDGTCLSQTLGSVYDFANNNGLLNEKTRLMVKGMRDYFCEKIKRNSFTDDDSREWLYGLLNFYVRSGIKLEKVEKILRSIELRGGVVDCFHYLKEQNIPIAIISFGFSQFVELALKANNAHYFVSEIYATNLLIDRHDFIIGLDPASIVLPGKEKGRFSRLFAKKNGVKYSKILAVGDSALDGWLGYLRKNRLGIVNSEERKEALKKSMGEVVVSEKFNPVMEWFKKRIETLSFSPAVSEDRIPCANPSCGEDGRICPECGNFLIKPGKIGN